MGNSTSSSSSISSTIRGTNLNKNFSKNFNDEKNSILNNNFENNSFTSSELPESQSIGSSALRIKFHNFVDEIINNRSFNNQNLKINNLNNNHFSDEFSDDDNQILLDAARKALSEYGDDDNFFNSDFDSNNYNNFNITTTASNLLKKFHEKLGYYELNNNSLIENSSRIVKEQVNMLKNKVILGQIDDNNASNGYNSINGKYHRENHHFHQISSNNNEDLLKQMEYDKFMNEVWIGIVLTLIIISLVFCICSCFLYHQFRQWKRHYRQNVQQNLDVESLKLNPEDDDPVPNYTLVSGLPSYEAALELLRNSSSSTALLMPRHSVTQEQQQHSQQNQFIPAPPYSLPSIFHVFSSIIQNEKEDSTSLEHEKLPSPSSSSSALPINTTDNIEKTQLHDIYSNNSLTILNGENEVCYDSSSISLDLNPRFTIQQE